MDGGREEIHGKMCIYQSHGPQSIQRHHRDSCLSILDFLQQFNTTWLAWPGLSLKGSVTCYLHAFNHDLTLIIVLLQMPLWSVPRLLYPLIDYPHSSDQFLKTFYEHLGMQMTTYMAINKNSRINI